MAQNPTIIAKKVWSSVRVAYFMLRKGVSKRKLLLDLNIIIKRGKIAGKALQNLMIHHHNNHTTFTTNNNSDHLSFPSPPPEDYEYSCTTSPATSKPSENLDMMAVNAVLQAMEMIHSEKVSPALPGFGRSPMVRQLRVTGTDSLFPVSGMDEDSHVDEAAEQFISRFYHDLRRQNSNESFWSS